MERRTRREFIYGAVGCVGGFSGCSGNRGDSRDGQDIVDDDSGDATESTVRATDGQGIVDGDSGAGTVDGFEDRDLSEYSGQLSYYRVRSNNVISGTHSLQAPDAGNGGGPGTWERGGYNTIVSVSGLDRYPEPGTTFSVDIRIDDRETYGAVLWGVQSDSHPWPGYRLRIDTGGSPGVELEKIGRSGPIESHIIDQEAPENVLSDRENSGFAPEFQGDRGNHPVPEQDTVYTCTITWQTNGKMPYVCRDQDGNVLVRDDDPKADTAYQDGGIGFMSTQSGDYVPGRGVTWDNYVIR